MTVTPIEKLVSIASPPLGPEIESMPAILAGWSLGAELYQLLREKNGFYTFESALHVFPSRPGPGVGLSLEEWNSLSLWRGDYGELARDLLFFAEDVFQDQFCLSPRGVVRFDAETGRTIPVAPTIEGWARTLLADYAYQTGWALASQWQMENRPLAPGCRLVPKMPFFLGGQYTVDNLWESDAVQGMHAKADIVMQTRDLKAGEAVQLIVGKKPPQRAE